MLTVINATKFISWKIVKTFYNQMYNELEKLKGGVNPLKTDFLKVYKVHSQHLKNYSEMISIEHVK